MLRPVILAFQVMKPGGQGAFPNSLETLGNSSKPFAHCPLLMFKASAIGLCAFLDRRQFRRNVQ